MLIIVIFILHIEVKKLQLTIIKINLNDKANVYPIST